MPAILPSVKIDSDAMLAQCFMPHQIRWIQAEDAIRTPDKSLWNLYYGVILNHAIELGLLDVINRVQRTTFKGDQFVADCQARARREEIFQQSYVCAEKRFPKNEQDIAGDYFALARRTTEQSGSSPKAATFTTRPATVTSPGPALSPPMPHRAPARSRWRRWFFGSSNI